MHSKQVFSLITTACLLACVQSVRADDEIDSAEVVRLQNTGEIVAPEQIRERALARQAGEVTEIELKQKNGQYAYEVDVVDDQRIKRELTFDAKTGDFIASEEDDDDGENDDADADEAGNSDDEEQKAN